MDMHSLRQCALAAATLALAGTGPAHADPTGLWRGSDGGTTRIAACGAALCGYLATVVPPIDPETSRPWTDKHNANARKRSRPLVGTPVLIRMQPSGAGRWSGQLYYYVDGNTYSGHLIEQGPGNIRIEGCVLGMCGGEDMTRIR